MQCNCPYCNNIIETVATLEYIQGRPFHSSCADLFQSKSGYRITNQDKLLTYIARTLGKAELPLNIIRQIANYNNMGITDIQILATLRYFIEIQGGQLKPDGGIGIISYVLDAASEYYDGINKTIEKNRGAKVVSEVVVIKSPPRRTSPMSKVKKIDF